jgi:hypothetical protein
MLKVNLQNELLKQNKSLVSARELLLIREYDRTAQLAEDTTIKRVFGELPAAEGGRIKTRKDALLGGTKNFNQENVFHISQIESLCKKYHLRFLPSVMYKGVIDNDLPGKISQFEIAYGVECKEWKMGEYRSSGYFGGNTFIAAPRSSFKLQERPKDPLLFFQINHEYYYLIHKWGNDLSLIRRSYKMLSSWLVSMLVVVLPVALLVVGIFSKYADEDDKVNGGEIVAIMLGIGLIAFVVFQCVWQEDGFTIMKPSDWRSEFSD